MVVLLRKYFNKC